MHFAIYAKAMYVVEACSNNSLYIVDSFWNRSDNGNLAMFPCRSCSTPWRHPPCHQSQLLDSQMTQRQSRVNRFSTSTWKISSNLLDNDQLMREQGPLLIVSYYCYLCLLFNNIYSQFKSRVTGQWTMSNFCLLISSLMIVNIDLYALIVKLKRRPPSGTRSCCMLFRNIVKKKKILMYFVMYFQYINKVNNRFITYN